MKIRTVRRKTFSSAVVVISVVGIIFTTTGLTYAAPSSESTTSNLADLTIDKAYVTAGIKSNSSNEFLSMVWTTKNLGPASVGPEITYSHVTGMHVLGTSCIWRGVAGGGDGDFCETSFGRPNASAGTYVVYGQVGPTDGGPISVTVCVTDLGGDVVDPNPANNCKTLTVNP